MFTKQNKTKQKIYKHVTFAKIKSLQTSYVYKTRQNKCLQIKSLQTRYVYKTNKCLQNKSLTNTLCLENKSLQTRYF